MSLGGVKKKKSRLFAKDTPEDVRVLSLYPFSSPRVCPALITPHCNTADYYSTSDPLAHTTHCWQWIFYIIKAQNSFRHQNFY